MTRSNDITLEDRGAWRCVSQSNLGMDRIKSVPIAAPKVENLMTEDRDYAKCVAGHPREKQFVRSCRVAGYLDIVYRSGPKVR